MSSKIDLSKLLSELAKEGVIVSTIYSIRRS